MNDPYKRSASELFRKALERLSRMSGEDEGAEPARETEEADPRPEASEQTEPRSLAEEVREVQEGRRRRAESAAIRSPEDIEDVLTKTYAAAAERRSEERAEYLLASDPIEETPLGVETGEDAPEIEVRRDPA